MKLIDIPVVPVEVQDRILVLMFISMLLLCGAYKAYINAFVVGTSDARRPVTQQKRYRWAQIGLFISVLATAITFSDGIDSTLAVFGQASDAMPYLAWPFGVMMVASPAVAIAATIFVYVRPSYYAKKFNGEYVTTSEVRAPRWS